MTNFKLLSLIILGWGIGSFFYKLSNNHLHPVLVSTIATCVYIFITPFYFLWFKVNLNINFYGVLFAIIGALFICTGSLSYFFALQKSQVGTTTSIACLYPAITLILSCAFLDEEMNWRKGAGCILALISIFILSKK